MQQPAVKMVTVALPKGGRLILPTDVTVEDFDVMVDFVRKSVRLQVEHSLLEHNTLNPNPLEEERVFHGPNRPHRFPWKRARCRDSLSQGNLHDRGRSFDDNRSFENTRFPPTSGRHEYSSPQLPFGAADRPVDNRMWYEENKNTYSPATSSKYGNRFGNTTRTDIKPTEPNPTRPENQSSKPPQDSPVPIVNPCETLFPRVAAIKAEESVIDLDDDDET